MSDSHNEALVRAIHRCGCRLVLVVTGGGASAIGQLLRVPGGSRSVLEAVVPYSAEALTDYLRVRPEQFCAEATARAMATVALQRCWRWTSGARSSSPGDESSGGQRTAGCLGIGCTASLVSDVAKRGPHRIHVAAQADCWTESVSLELVKGARDRPAEEEIAAALILELAGRGCGVEVRPALSLLPDETIVRARLDAPDAWRELYVGRRTAVAAGAESQVLNLPLPRAILPGAFHPLHDGHRRMAQLAAARLGVDVHFELSIENVDKPPLDFLEIDERRRQFAAPQAVWLTRAPTFVRKADVFPGATFVVGADTILRIGDPKYYDNSESACHEAIRAIGARGCRFLVFGRLCDGTFCALADLPLAPDLRALCDGIDERTFRVDVSSTELRAASRETDS